MRLDDDVWAEVLKLRSVYGTDNAAMRFVFGLSGTAKVKSIDRTKLIPEVTLTKMPPDLSADSVITKLSAKSIEYTRPQRGPLLKPSEQGKQKGRSD